MSYRNPNQQRIQNQLSTIQQFAGHTATWRQFVSGASGVSVAGFGGTDYYREQTVTALFSFPTFEEAQRSGGMIAAGDVYASTRQPLARQDELVWRGSLYRAESDAVPETVNGQWRTLLKRATP